MKFKICSEFLLMFLLVSFMAATSLQAPKCFNAELPYDPNIDGVGIHEETGDLYFMSSLVVPFFAERVNIKRGQLVKLELGTDPLTMAAMANPFGSSWMALQCRAIGGCRGRTVAIVGTTSGRASICVARFIGASRIVGSSHDAETLAKVEGLDDRVVLTDDFSMPSSVGPVYIMLD
jgi:threonine dehydrogenase-like Zn-dependent dehydrogenase